MGAGKPVKLDCPSLAGGVIEGMAPTNLQDEYFSALRNFYPFASDLKRRKGMSKVNLSEAPANITSCCAYKPYTGDYRMIAGLVDGFARLNPDGTFTRLSISDGRTYQNVARRWCMLQFKDAWFASRVGEGTFKVGNASEAHDAGIPSPVTAPTLAAGAAGDLLAGDYYGVYTFYNSLTGDESNPSPVSAVCTLAGSEKINWSAILTSLTAGVDTRRLYRTYLNVTGEYYWVADINDNVSTSFTGDNVLAADMGARASWLNGMPPAIVTWIAAWDERLFATDGRDIYLSELSKPQAFYPGNVIWLYRDDKKTITCLHALGDRLMVFKTASTHYLTGAAGDYKAITLSDKHGCPAPWSVASGEGVVCWFGGDNFYKTDGNEVKAIGNVEIRNTVDAIPRDMFEYMDGSIRPEESLYICCYPSSSLSSYNDKFVCYNYKTGMWSHGDNAYPSGASMFLTRDVDEDGNECNFAIFPSSKDIYKWWDETTYTDYGTNFTCSFKTGGKFAGHGLRCALKNFMVMCDSVPGDVTLRVYLDGESVASVTRTGLSFYATQDAWKVFALSTQRQGLCGYFQIELEYTGSHDLTIQELSAQLHGYARVGRPR